jgi:hypothetical protein
MGAADLGQCTNIWTLISVVARRVLRMEGERERESRKREGEREGK